MFGDPDSIDGLTIGQMLTRTAERYGDRDAMVFPQAGLRMRWAQFDAAVTRIAEGLAELGFRPGDHFAVWSTNWPEWVLLQFATARLGIVLVTINPAYRSAELAYTLAHSDVRGLALSDSFRSTRYDDLLSEILPELAEADSGKIASKRFPRLQWLIRMRGEEHPGMLCFEALGQLGSAAFSPHGGKLACGVLASQPVNLQYTSGTTGNPKGALLTHRNLLLNAAIAGRCQRLDHRDRILIPVPLYHCFGCVLGSLAAAVCGAAMVFPAETFQPAATLDAIYTERCTAIYGVPTMFIALLEHPDFDARRPHALRTGIMAGSPCPVELMKRVTSEMGVEQITIGYGQTESSPLITMTRTDDSLERRVTTVGPAIPGVEARIVDPETGDELADGLPGELCTRGHNVMLGYYNEPEMTRAAIDADGWLHTGDLALRDREGYFRITGRLKDMIIRGGENVAPREIEELLFQHADVEDVQVVGVPDERYGEEILACVRLRPGGRATETELQEFCRARLAHFKTPRYVWLVEDFPKTVTGKIQKFRLRELAIEHFQLAGDEAEPTA